ncbi:MAG: hypothetical protein HZA50_11750 [Planctomycetes bacterium]|nr:hypothetical protein [Planctomycetota bacterium]
MRGDRKIQVLAMALRSALRIIRRNYARLCLTDAEENQIKTMEIIAARIERDEKAGHKKQKGTDADGKI